MALDSGGRDTGEYRARVHALGQRAGLDEAMRAKRKKTGSLTGAVIQ